jgi:uncharacterized protein (TIGR00730 family)
MSTEQPERPARPAAPNHEERSRLIARLKESPAYRIAFEDPDFLKEEVLRPVRLEMELLKPEMMLRRLQIRSTIVVFGSARILPPETARARRDAVRQALDATRGDKALTARLAQAERAVSLSRYYDEARRFSRTVSTLVRRADRNDFVVVTGGGPGIMEAANRGAYDVRALSGGFNITLPEEQEPNPYVSPELCFQFHYFALRKMHFLLRAVALVAFPGGYGTFDELFEALTLVQTRKMQRMPIVLVGREYWTKVVNFDFLVEEGTISPEDRELVSFVETSEEAVRVIYDFYNRDVPDLP